VLVNLDRTCVKSFSVKPVSAREESNGLRGTEQ
jgi:hypothetical protein